MSTLAVRMRRAGRRIAVVLVPLIVMFSTSVVAAGSASAVTGIYPTLQCVTYSPNTDEVTAHFGYVNFNDGAQYIPVGGTNYFYPLSSDQGQPTSFASGTHEDAFEVTWSRSAATLISWTLLGQTVSASLSSANCSGQFAEDPSLTGVPTVGETLAVDLGTFLPAAIGYEPVAVTWTRDCDTSTPTTIGSGTTYLVQAEDATHRIGATVTYTETEESAAVRDEDPITVSSATACGAEALAGARPTLAAGPWVQGDATPGSVLSVAGTGWDGTAPMTQQVTWQRCNATACAAVGSDDTYVISDQDVGQQIRAVVTASNAWGSATEVTPSVVVEQEPSAGVLTLSPRSLSLHSRVDHRGPARAARLLNDTAGAVTVRSIRLTGGNAKAFVLAGGTCRSGRTLAASASCTVRVRLAAPRAGRFHATLVVRAGAKTLRTTLVGRARH